MADNTIILHGGSNYEDERGNKIIGSVPDTVKIEFCGENSIIEAGDNFKCGEGLRFRLCSGCRFSIGDNVSIDEWGTLNAYDNGTVIIGNNARFADGNFVSSCYDAVISFGRDFTMEAGNTIIALPFTQIKFGEDCMMSRGVTVQSNDGHSIFDVNTGENINSTEEISKTRRVVIGDHVWIGERAIILYNTVIGSGSVIGAGSFVKGRFPNNTTIAGVPAKIIKRDIAWSRYGGDIFENIPEQWRIPTGE